MWQAENKNERLLLKVQDAFLRTLEAHDHIRKRIEVFVQENVGNIGCHPFLLGLREAIQWNLESSTVVGWRGTINVPSTLRV